MIGDANYISKDPVAQQRAEEAAEMVEASARAASQGKRLKRSRNLSKKAQEAQEAKVTSITTQRGPRNPNSLWVRLNTQPPTYRHTRSGQVQVELPKEGWARRVDLTSSSEVSSAAVFSC